IFSYLFTHPAGISTLSLHDALPICILVRLDYGLVARNVRRRRSGEVPVLDPIAGFEAGNESLPEVGRNDPSTDGLYNKEGRTIPGISLVYLCPGREQESRGSVPIS